MPLANSIFSGQKSASVSENLRLSASLPKKPSLRTHPPFIAEDFGRIHMIALSRILPNPMQPRRSFEDDSIIRLADSIRRYGLLQPISLRRCESAAGEEIFEIIAGERRFRAATLLGMKEIPSIIIKANKRESAELAIIENIQRENLNIFEQASAIATLIDTYGMTQEEIASHLSASQSFVANKLRILRLTLPEREKILGASLSERHARALLKLDSPDLRLSAIDYIISHNLTVAATEEYVEGLVSGANSRKSARSTRKVILKDIRIFYNSIERAISIVKQAGVKVESQRVEENDSVCLTIRIPK